ncbi:hypothetical protein HHL16_11000 [Pseudoflavitalea sp. G-6-1-2]|uniref:hypothetical protein n=1 Tax=Pseudoflavitalea sp. G-6-1-2 TaxID=2728841 RepID=UPI00146E7D16|nr:hypothetical protein [Pseudoflavitalea sp. G-6-1-2]NML21405.1 hypothetical protein [Pseudoflavitalea sp. G-6-1-2]
MILQYNPKREVILDTVRLPFGISREIARVLLGNTHKEENEEFHFPDEEPINQRRDVYNRMDASGEYFFLLYDRNDLLKEVEMHHCKKIRVFDIEFGFTDDVDLIAEELSAHVAITEQEEGSYSFKDLGISIISEKQMGGEESNNLAYFYCTSDTGHWEKQ